MGRMKPAWYYERQAAEATARANYFKNKVPTVKDNVAERGATTQLYYRSLFKKLGTTHLMYVVNVLTSTLTKAPASYLGLLTDTEYTNLAPEAKISFPIRGSGVKYSKVSWYAGAASPTQVLTAWNTRYNRYYEADTPGTQTHYSAPISVAGGPFDAKDVKAAFELLVKDKKSAMLGTKNGRAQLTLERDVSAISN